jgi:hypothetical protein
MANETPANDPEGTDLSMILTNPYLRAVLDELHYHDAWQSGRVSPISAAVRIRQIRNAKLVPEKA